MPRDLFKEYGIDPNKREPIDIFKAEGIEPPQNQWRASGELGDLLLRKIAGSSPVQESASLIHDVAQSRPVQFPVNFMRGLGDRTANLGIALANKLGGAEIPEVHTGSGPDYELGGIGADVLGFESGGAALKGALKSAEFLPILSKYAKALGADNFLANLGRNTAGGAGFGALTNEDETQGALVGGGISAAADILPASIQKGYQVAKEFGADTAAKELIQKISGGRTPTENAKSLGQDIINNYRTKTGELRDAYNNWFTTHSFRPLYSGLNPFGKSNALSAALTGGAAKSAFKEAEQEFSPYYSKGLAKTADKFKSDPTVQNAHDFLSAIKKKERNLTFKQSKGTLTKEGEQELEALTPAKKGLEQDFFSGLEKVKPGLSDEYRALTEKYAQEVVPYEGIMSKISSDLGQSKGYLANQLRNAHYQLNDKELESISNVLQRPSPVVKKHLASISQDISPETSNKIIATQLSKAIRNPSAETLTKSMQDLEDKRLSKYITPQLATDVSKLESKKRLSEALQRLTVGLGAGAIGSYISPYVGGGGLLAGALLAPQAGHILQHALPKGASNELAKALKSAKKIKTPAKAIAIRSINDSLNSQEVE